MSTGKKPAAAGSNLTNEDLGKYVAATIKESDEAMTEAIREIVREELKAFEKQMTQLMSMQTIRLSQEMSTAVSNTITSSALGQKSGRAKAAAKSAGVPANNLSMLRALIAEGGDFYNTLITNPKIAEDYADQISRNTPESRNEIVITVWNMLNDGGITVTVDDEEVVWNTSVVGEIRAKRIAEASGQEETPSEAGTDVATDDVEDVEEAPAAPLKKASAKKAAVKKPAAPKAAAPKAAAPKAATPKAATPKAATKKPSAKK